MSYSLSVPNVARDVELVELQDRVMATCDAVGLSEEQAAPGVRNRIRESVNEAMDLINKLELTGDVFNFSFAGHVAQETDASPHDYASIMITRALTDTEVLT